MFNLVSDYSFSAVPLSLINLAYVSEHWPAVEKLTMIMRIANKYYVIVLWYIEDDGGLVASTTVED